MERLFPQRSGAEAVPKQVEEEKIVEKIVVHGKASSKPSSRRSSVDRDRVHVERVDKLLADRDAGTGCSGRCLTHLCRLEILQLKTRQADLEARLEVCSCCVHGKHKKQSHDCSNRQHERDGMVFRPKRKHLRPDLRPWSRSLRM